jgi:hypothetical protein
MSMEAYVLSTRRLSSQAEWQRAIDAAVFSVQLMSERPLLERRGHLPARWQGREAGFECGHGNAAELMQDYPEVDFGARWAHLLAFRWSTLPGSAAAYCAAAAYAAAVNGVMFDPQEGPVMTPDQALDLARETEAGVPNIERRLAESARPAATRSSSPGTD